jgi:hypothetical protein
MLATQELNFLAERKAALLVQSAANRAKLTRACADVERSAGWIEAGYGLVSRVRPAVTLATPVLGILAAWRWRRTVAWGRRLGVALRVARIASGFWRRFKRED